MIDIKFTGNKIRNKIDLEKIRKKADDGKYDSFQRFRSDIVTFVNNCRISRSRFVDVSANKLQDFVEAEIFSITACQQCYSLAYKYPDLSFEMICEEPHPIVWAEAPGCSYWPAKLMTVYQDRQNVHVRFFGDHTVLNLKADNLYFFSDTIPGTIDDFFKDDFNKANEVSQKIAALLIKWHFA